MKEQVKEQISRAPKQPGVYIFKNAAGAYLYVGKAIRLKDRLRSYINPQSDSRPSIALMVPKVDTVEWFVTDNEKEALILENNLIKTYRPKYNIMYRDDKTYLSLKLTKHVYPRLYKTRNIMHDGGTYFGPFSSVSSVNHTLKLLQKIFQVRDCTDYFFKTRIRPCLRYQIHLCSAPCVKKVSQDEYMEQVLQIQDFMKGDYKSIVGMLEDKMKKASVDMQYEQAAHYRDQILAIEETLTPQKAESREAFQDHLDVVGITGDEQATLIKLVKIRAGTLVDADEYYLDESIRFKEDVLRSFMQLYYLEDFSQRTFPKEILLPFSFEDAHAMEELLADKAKHALHIRIPQKGKKKKYVDLATKNAEVIFLEKKRQSTKTLQTLEDIQKKFQLPTLPKRIEGYDISNFQGMQSFGSQVVFTNGEKDTNQYRIYSIKTVKGPDDFASLREVLTRRLKKLQDHQKPDLLLIDGGKGQLAQAVEVLSKLELNIPVLSIAKEKELKTKSGIKYAPERIYIPGQKNSVVFPIQSPILQLFQRVRDEAHRFGLKHHRNQRSKQTLSSMLTQIPGIGTTRQKRLLSHFGSIDHIQRATKEELLRVTGMNDVTATSVLQYFLSNQNVTLDEE
ncbi:MAG: excinuclease ABC subunit UvrC [Bdellovibrionales bacterium]|nr:excinuclease ABC subunit UvrC [Bdellovibrionales bacterium]